MFEVSLESIRHTNSEWGDDRYHIIINNDNVEWSIFILYDSIYEFKKIYKAINRNRFYNVYYEEYKKIIL